MDQQLGDLEAQVPTLSPGVTVLTATLRSSAHHQLVLATLQSDRGPVIWIDAGDTASTYTLYELTHRRRLLEEISIARAWTAYQHHSLIRQAIKDVTPRTRLVVVPNVEALYLVDDVDDDEADWLLHSTIRTLAALAQARSIPILLTSARPDVLPDDCIDAELEWEQTPEGATFAGDAGRTMLHRGAWWWQTTIPYWVDLFGGMEQDRWESMDTFVYGSPAILEY